MFRNSNMGYAGNAMRPNSTTANQSSLHNGRSQVAIPQGGGGSLPRKQTLVQKLEGTMQNLRKERDRAYRQKVEAEERLRLAKVEEESLVNTVRTFNEKYSKLLHRKEEVDSSLGPLDAQVRALTSKVDFQHTELLKARTKIHEQTAEIEATTADRTVRLQSIQRLGQEFRIKLRALKEKQGQQLLLVLNDDLRDSSDPNARDSVDASNAGPGGAPLKSVLAKDTLQSSVRTGSASRGKRLRMCQINRLERELSCLMFEWERMPKLVQDRIDVYQSQFQEVKTKNDAMEQELLRRNISLPIIGPSEAHGTTAISRTIGAGTFHDTRMVDNVSSPAQSHVEGQSRPMEVDKTG